MKKEVFENLLDTAKQQLKRDIQKSAKYREPQAFEDRVRETLAKVFKDKSIAVKPYSHPHAFPDITINGFGVEVKSTRQDTWRTTANSILETMRDESSRQIYVMFGKMGGSPDVRWGLYEECVYHVRLSHAPRFCVEMTGEEKSLFATLGISYEEFSRQTPELKMAHVRNYARSRLQKGERIWWLEEDHALPLNVQRFSNLSLDKKKEMRAEGAVLCPEIVSPPMPNKYDGVMHFLITYRGILASRDMYTAGSVGMKGGQRGGQHIVRQFADIEHQMKEAFEYLEPALFEEYWEIKSVPKEWRKRLAFWLKLADKHAKGKWTPSKVLFTNI